MPPESSADSCAPAICAVRCAEVSLASSSAWPRSVASTWPCSTHSPGWTRSVETIAGPPSDDGAAMVMTPSRGWMRAGAVIGSVDARGADTSRSAADASGEGSRALNTQAATGKPAVASSSAIEA